MPASPSPIGFPISRHARAESCVERVKDFEKMARLVEELIPAFKQEDDRQFYREVVEIYRRAARDAMKRGPSKERERH